MSGHYRKEKNCLNCGHQVEDHYCSYCGQPNLELKEPFWAFITHSIGHYFHFDSKFFHTLVPLITKPGQITLDYLAGKRAKYIHPVSLYIFVSIVYFLIVPHAIEHREHGKEAENTTKQDKTSAGNRHEGRAESSKVLEYSDDDNEFRNVPELVGTPLKEMLSANAFKKLDYPHQKIHLDSLRKVNTVKKSDSLSNVIDDLGEIFIARQDSTYASYLQRQQTLPASERDGWFTRMQRKKEIELNTKKSTGKWDLKEEMKKYQPKQYFLLMPLLAFFIMLNFRKNHIYYIDHLIFTIHGMTAYFLISIIAEPIQAYIFGRGSTMSDIISIAVYIGIAWYFYTGLQTFYKRSRRVTIRKMITLIFLYGISLAITAFLVKTVIMYLLA